ncbi:MAG: heavy metal translocating P-type ATPase [Firmicutes bacterium]|nr:heavy metal translocating P-type ATPase [Bacillota bacterium]
MDGQHHSDHQNADHAHHTRHGHNQSTLAGAPGSHARHSGGSDHSSHSPQAFKNRFWISLLLTVPILVYSHHIQAWFGFSPPHFTGSEYMPPLLGLVIYLYGGVVFLRGSLQELRSQRPGMMTLISLAITVAFGYSALVTAGFPGEDLYWELATLVVIMLLGHWLEMGAVQSASGALAEMARLMPDTAWRIENDEPREVAVSVLSRGELILIRPGARIPVDGSVIEGESHVNESMITGESIPVVKKPGDRVIAGSLNDDGSLRVTVEKTGSETALAGIMRLVEQAQSSRSRAQILADRAAFWLVMVAVGSALLTALAWGLSDASPTFIMERVVTVLVAACPHALGLAIPLVVAISTSLSARNGLLIKDRLAFEQARQIDYVVFDKTGTLTQGEHELVSIYTTEGLEEERALVLAAAAEADSEHMISRGMVRAARRRGIALPPASSFEYLAGRGVRAVVENQEIRVGGPNLLSHLGLTLPPTLVSGAADAGSRGETVVYLVFDGSVQAVLTFADVVREESREAVNTLKEQGVKVAMLTGDSEAVARNVARDLKIDRFFAGVLPENKASKIEELKREGHRVAMVGDGVNDAPALVTADVGIAIGAGTDVAVESAGIVLVQSDPRGVARLINLSRAAYRKMVQNLAWATGYNLLVIPLAAGVLAPVGFVLPMAAGAIVMSASTIIVALNAQLLHRFRG